MRWEEWSGLDFRPEASGMSIEIERGTRWLLCCRRLETVGVRYAVADRKMHDSGVKVLARIQ